MIGLPRTGRELAARYSEAHAPEVSEFAGEYRVRMLTRLPSLTWFAHRKVFLRDAAGVSGCNVLLRDLKWGYFSLEKGVSPGRERLEVVTINYDRPENTFLTRGIRDHVRRIDEGMYLGTFNMFMMGRLRFLGYFSLEKIGPGR